MGRFGIVGYLNAHPLTDHLDRGTHQVLADHPSGIARALAEGEVDLALCPVAAVFNDGDYRIVPGWCIGSAGPVASVLLVAEVPPEQWTRVVLDGVSRTSAILARLLLAGPLAERVPADLIVEDGPPGCAFDVAGGTTAALVIGDAARRVPERLTERLDLAELWRSWTGLPFVFAVWAGRPHVAPELRLEVRRAGALGVAEIDQRYSGEDRTYLAERLRYPLDDLALMGLRRFAALGHAAGLLEVSDPSLYPPAEARVVRGDWRTLLERAVGGDSLDDDEVRGLATAPVAELAAGADLLRHDHGTERVGYRLAVRVTSLAEAQAAIAGGATVLDVDDPELVASLELPTGVEVRAVPAADHELATWLDHMARAGARRLHPVVWAHPDGDRLVQRAAELGLTLTGLIGDGDDPVGELLAHRRRGTPVLRCAAGSREALRLCALARLVTDARVEAAGDGSTVSQAALRMGADHMGTVTLHGPPEAWRVQIAEVERQIRAAGFDPAREASGVSMTPTTGASQSAPAR